MSAARRRENVIEIPPSRLNPTDATLWDIERNPSLRTTIVAVMVLDRPVDRELLLNALEAATRQVSRLRQRVVERKAGVGVPHWEVDAGFDLADHVSFVDVAGPVDEAAIAALAEPMASSPFDRTRPLWECVYVGGTTGRTALVLKVHHSLTDGVGGVGLLDAFLDRRRGARPRDLDRIPIPRPASGPHPGAEDLDRLIRRGVGIPFDIAGAASSALFHPRRVAGGTWDGARSAVRMLAPSTAPLSPLMVGRSVDRHIGVTDVDLARLRRAAVRHGCTLNHAFFAGALGGIAEYHRALGQPAERLRVTMPVSFRRTGDEQAGNQWAPVRFVVPTDIADPLERMHTMATLVRTHKSERALSFSQQLAGLVQVLPSVLSSGVVAGMMHGVDVTLTNVPGFTEAHYLAGAAVERIYAFSPTAGAALNVSFVSHVGTACIGALSDAAAVSEPALLQRLIAAQFDDLMGVAEGRAPTHQRSREAAPPQPRAHGAAERLSALDAAFLALETPETPMHIGAAFVLEGGPLRQADGTLRLDDIRRHIDARIRTVPRLTRCVVEVPLGVGRPLWVDDADFDIRRHVLVTAVDPPGDQQALLDRCAELHSEPLDRTHPLWQLWLVDGLADGRVGIVEKIHHALVDGVGGVDVAAALFDIEPTVEPDVPVRTAPVPGPSAPKRFVDAVVGQLADPPRVAGHVVSAAVRAPEQLVARVGSAVAAAGELVRPGSRAPRASFNRHVGRRRALRAIAVDLDQVRRVGEPVGATVNDVVLAAVTGGVRSWLMERGEPPIDVHVLVPVSVRHGSLQVEPGNRVGGVMVALPVGEPDPGRRLEIVESRMKRLKAAHEGEGAAALLGALDHAPVLDRALTRLVAVQPFVNFVVTNVPGSPVALHLLESRIETIVPIVPLGPGLGLGIAVLTYAGRMSISIAADPELCPDIAGLASAIADELSALAAATSDPLLVGATVA